MKKLPFESTANRSCGIGAAQDGNVESDFFLLLAGHEGCYQSDMGLRLDSFNTDGEPFMF